MGENTKVDGRMGNSMVMGNFCKMLLVNGEKASGVKEKECAGLMGKLQVKALNDNELY